MGQVLLGEGKKVGIGFTAVAVVLLQEAAAAEVEIVHLIVLRVPLMQTLLLI